MADLDVDAKGAHTENRRSAGPDRIELITRGERRRSWTIEQKREIAVESLAPGTVSAATARRHGIGTGLLYTWRKQLLNGELGEVTRLVPSFLRVDMEQEPGKVRASGPGPLLQVERWQAPPLQGGLGARGQQHPAAGLAPWGWRIAVPRPRELESERRLKQGAGSAW